MKALAHSRFNAIVNVLADRSGEEREFVLVVCLQHCHQHALLHQVTKLRR